MSVEFVNCTPHAVNIHREDGTVFTVDPSGNFARVATNIENVEISGIEGIKVVRTTFDTTKVDGLPAPEEGVIYIVSLITLNALKGIRTDLVAPGNLIRDEKGNIVGCDGLTIA
jgi:hypothetical protein